MQKTNSPNFDHDRCAGLIRAAMAVKRITQVELCKQVGVHRVLLSSYLCRKIDLLSGDIEKILTKLGIEGLTEGGTRSFETVLGLLNKTDGEDR